MLEEYNCKMTLKKKKWYFLYNNIEGGKWIWTHFSISFLEKPKESWIDRAGFSLDKGFDFVAAILFIGLEKIHEGFDRIF